MFPSFVTLGKPGKKLIDQNAARKLIENALEETAKEAERLFHEVDSTWSHKIKVTKSSVVWGQNASIKITTDDDIFWWLNEGVPRHAIMSSDFIPKTTATRPATFKSGSGGGTRNPLWISRYPVAYIRSRGWTMTMADILQIYLLNKLKNTMSGSTIIRGVG